MSSIQQLNATDNWDSVKTDILKLENESFAPSIRYTEFVLEGIYNSKNNITLLYIKNKQVLAYLMASALEYFYYVDGVKTDMHLGYRDTLYFASIAVSPPFRNLGIGTKLEKELIKLNKLPRLTAHIKYKSNIKIPTKILNTHTNWYNTGDTFNYVTFGEQK